MDAEYSAIYDCRDEDIDNYEGHYASIFYSHFAAFGVHIAVADSNKNGKVYRVIEFNNSIFIFEFKIVEDQAKPQPIYLMGVEFSKKQQQIIGLEINGTDLSAILYVLH